MTNNIYQKLSRARVDLQDLNLKQTGSNKYSNYTYFELPDFLPAINAICDKLGLFTQFNIVSNKGKELAVLKIFNSEKPEEFLTFTSETAEVEIGKKKDGSGGAEPIQNLGGKITYMRRYVYMTAFEIAESDLVEQINKSMIKELSEKDEKRIKDSKNFDELTKVCGELKKTYKVELITPLFEAKKIEFEQNAEEGSDAE